MGAAARMVLMLILSILGSKVGAKAPAALSGMLGGGAASKVPGAGKLASLLAKPGAATAGGVAGMMGGFSLPEMLMGETEGSPPPPDINSNDANFSALSMQQQATGPLKSNDIEFLRLLEEEQKRGNPYGGVM